MPTLSNSYTGETRYLPATSRKPAMIQVRAGAQVLGETPYNCALSFDDNHKQAFAALALAQGIAGDWRGAEMYSSSSYIWIRTDA